MIINKKFILLLIVDIISVGLIYYIFNKKMQESNRMLKNEISQLQQTIIYKDNFNAKIVNNRLKNQINAIVSIRCSHKDKFWNGTATRIGEKTFLTASHVLNYIAPTTNVEIHPQKCELYSKGDLIGQFSIKKNKYEQFYKKDIALFTATLDKDAGKVKIEKPQVQAVINGQPLILISHPDHFINDPLVTFGLVVSANIQKSLQIERQISWKDAILTDMSATGGSSGAPLFATDGSYIGIHVGGKRDLGLNINYQLLFDYDLLSFIKKFND